MRILCLFLSGVTLAAAAGPFSWGIKAGVPLTDFVSTADTGRFVFHPDTHRFLVGGMGELRLPFGVAAEFDIIYRRLAYNGSGTLSITNVTTNGSTTANAWEFPLLVKYRFPAPVARPYLEAGVAWDHLSGLKQTFTQVIGGQTTNSSTSTPAELNKTTTTGVVLGVGLDVHAIFLHISPEIRYTRWGSKHFQDPNGLVDSQQNQAEFLVGFTF